MLHKSDLIKIYESRPFKTRNADEYDLSDILDLFVDPTKGLKSPFDYENSIIKGGMGSGKTMYLRANHAYYLARLVASLLSSDSLILPIYIRLSDFQNISDPNEIYKRVILKIITEILTINNSLYSAEKLAHLHLGIVSLPPHFIDSDAVLKRIQQLSCEEYIETVQKGIETQGSASYDFFQFSAKYNKENTIELHQKPHLSIQDVSFAYQTIVEPFNGKMILLFDEAGSLNKSFFRNDSNDSLFETLMNQLRTINYLRTKVAIYPKDESDVLTETRYGDVIELEETINTNDGYLSFRAKTIGLVEKYVENESRIPIGADDLISITPQQSYGDALEQLIYASDGNMRRLIHLLDNSMDTAYSTTNGMEPISTDNVISALNQQANDMERLFSERDQEFLLNIASTCKSRSTYRFTYSDMAAVLNKYVNKSEEYNLLNIIERGAGRKGNVYAFDYCYCVCKDIPTHYIKDTERIDKTRSLITGEWIKRISGIDPVIMTQAQAIGKIYGQIQMVLKSGGAVIIDDEQGEEYLMTNSAIIRSDAKKELFSGRKVRFMPFKNKEFYVAQDVEIL